MSRRRLQRLRSVGLRSSLPIGIDFGVRQLKLLQLAAGDPPSLVAAAAIDTPVELLRDHAGRMKFQLDAMPKLLRRGNFKGKRVICSIPAPQMFCKHMRFKLDDGLKTGEMVRAAVSNQLGCHPDALLYRHVEVTEIVQSSGGTKSEVVCLAASRALVNKVMDRLRSCKLEPVGLQPECLALVSAFEHMGDHVSNDDSVLYLDIGVGTTKVVITHGQRLVFSKTIQIGGYDLDKAVAGQLRCEFQHAHDRRLMAEHLTLADMHWNAAASSTPVGAAVGGSGSGASGGTDGGDETSEDRLAFDLTDQLEALTDEIGMCQRYHEQLFNGRRVTKAVFVGGESRHLALCRHIARKLRLPTHVADPLTRVGRSGSEATPGVDLSEPRPGWAVPFGLCMSPTDL